MAGATTLADAASAITARAEEASIVVDLKAGSEDAYSWLIAHYHQPIYSLIYRIVNDPLDAADTTQEVFLKAFRGIKRFHGEASLKTWLYRIAVNEASNQRRWWFRHRRRETSMEIAAEPESGRAHDARRSLLVDRGLSPFDSAARQELRQRVAAELQQVPEPYRTAVVLRDIEELSYDEIAEVLQISLGTVKSRLTRGREALKDRLAGYVEELGISPSSSEGAIQEVAR